MKILRIAFLALFAGLATQAFAQVDLNNLALAIEESPEDTADLVEEAVASSPTQVEAILSRLLGEFPELAEQVIVGVVNGLPDPVTEEQLSAVLGYAIRFSPGLAAEIVRGAREATQGNPELQSVIVTVAQNVLRDIPGTLGASSDPTQETVYEDSLRISPAR